MLVITQEMVTWICLEVAFRAGSTGLLRLSGGQVTSQTDLFKRRKRGLAAQKITSDNENTLVDIHDLDGGCDRGLVALSARLTGSKLGGRISVMRIEAGQRFLQEENL